MKYLSPKFFALIFLICVTLLQAQNDPSSAIFSKLLPNQRQQLMKQYGISDSSLPKSDPTAQLPNSSIEIVTPDEDTFDDRSAFLEDLNSMERMISDDVTRLQSQVNLEDSSEGNELLEALEESKALLRKIKTLQRREIEKRAEEFRKSEIDTIKPFGYDLFASDPSTFAPGNEVPIPSDYRIGPGDLVEIQLFGQRNDSFSLGISREGMIRFPGIGPINAFEKGTSFIELKNHLKEKIREHLGEGVQSSITLGGFRSIRIFLLGEVRKQGAYTVSALSTTINALLSCGGIKETGSLRKIQLKRSGEIVSTLDLYDLLLNGDTSADQPLQPGDVIFVPVIEKQVAISGAVKRPAKYEILGEENLENVIDIAGGPSDRSILNLIRLERLNSDYRTIVKNLSLPKDKDVRVSSGDFISLGFAGSSIINKVSIVGAVENVGNFEWKDGLALSDLINTSDDFFPNIDLNYGIIRRQNQNGTFSCIAFEPHELLNSESKSILLQPQDIIYFFSRNKKSREDLLKALILDLRSQTNAGNYARLIRISGTVHFPGDYPLTDGMSLYDLFNAGGGTKDSAYMLDAEVTRMVVGSEQVASVSHIRLDRNILSDSNVKVIQTSSL